MKTESLILSTATRYLLPLLLLFSIFLLLRGHYEPGGGFVGGLVAAAAFALNVIAFGVPRTREILRLDPRVLIGSGVLLAAISGMIAWLSVKPYLKMMSSGIFEGHIRGLCRISAAFSKRLKMGLFF